MGGPLSPIDTYRDALSAVFQQHGVVLAYLYGSQARGDAGPLSDVDIAVMFPREMSGEERFHHILDLHGDLQRVLERDDAYVIDLDKSTPLLNNEIRMDGIILYCIDEDARVQFEIQTMREYLDTIPLRQEFNIALLSRIRQGSFAGAMPVLAAGVTQ